MPIQSVTLRPGVNLEMTPALNEAGISQSQLIRTKGGLTQSLGGWQLFGPNAVPSTVRDLHPWQDVAGTDFLGIGATSNLAAITAGSYQDITPLSHTENSSCDFSISSGITQVTVNDPNSNPSVYTTVFFNTPVSIGNLLLDGAYQITAALSTGTYTFSASIAANVTISNSGVVPKFNSSANSAFVTVTQPNHTAQSITGLQQTFRVPTVVDGLTISGPYSVFSVLDSTSYIISSPTAATATAGPISMNSSQAQLVYYVAGGPLATGTGYGGLGYGLGGYGTGSPDVTGGGGSPIGPEADWSLDNWGEVLLSCPKDGPIFAWSPDIGLRNAKVIAKAPFFSGGIFVSMPQQILVAWKSTQTITGTQDNLIVRWSDAGDYTNWEVSNQTAAGSFHIPTGSVIVGGLQSANYGVIWTDVDVWIMQYTAQVIAGVPIVFNFTRVGSGCGLLAQHACGVIAGDVYWCGKSNFFRLSGQGVEILPCTVWDFIFQNMDAANSRKIRCAPNSAFNEISWFFPTTGMTENNAYVKFNISDQTWDYGFLARTAWCDVSVTGNPFGSDPGGFINQHDVSLNIDSVATPSFQTGWWAISDGNEMAFVDFVMPDFQWGLYGTTTTSLQVSFFSADYPGDTPTSYGPYTVTRATEYITPRIRGRLMSMKVMSATNNSFWRLGRIRYRVAPAGRR